MNLFPRYHGLSQSRTPYDIISIIPPNTERETIAITFFYKAAWFKLIFPSKHAKFYRTGLYQRKWGARGSEQERNEKKKNRRTAKNKQKGLEAWSFQLATPVIIAVGQRFYIELDWVTKYSNISNTESFSSSGFKFFFFFFIS